MEQADIDRFRQARFGMFIHWGLYSSLGGRWQGQAMDYIGEWVQSRFRIPNHDYAALAGQFNPLNFNADDWVKTAKNAGMNYLVFTAKHHDGFALYHSRTSRYNIVEATPFGRDVLRELAEACHRHEMKLGIYYSHCLDWHESDGADPGPESPKNFGMSWGNDWDYPDHHAKHFSRYFENKAKKQITELLTGYGPVFLLWFDCPLTLTQEQGWELRTLVHALQPHCLISGRIGHGLGDFGSLGDNQHPAGQSDFPLESPNTLNHTWGFKWDDHGWMGAQQVVGDLAALNEKNVNYLLNIGPCGDGSFPEPAMDLLRKVAAWRQSAQVAIQRTQPNPFPQSFPWGWCTVSGKTLQFFVRDWNTRLVISGLRNKITSCTVPFAQSGETLTLVLPERDDSLLPVIKVAFAGELDIDQRLMPQSGVLLLIPSTGTVCHGALAAGTGLTASRGAAAEVMEEEPVCSIDSSGALTQWQHPGDGAGWPVYFPLGGAYQVSALTENRCHSAPWVGARTVEVTFSNQTLTAVLNLDEKIGSAYYSKAVSELGTLHAAAGESATISIKTLGISLKDAVNMNLTAIKLQQLDDR
jgi:alpha-L-fucosidase